MGVHVFKAPSDYSTLNSVDCAKVQKSGVIFDFHHPDFKALADYAEEITQCDISGLSDRSSEITS